MTTVVKITNTYLDRENSRTVEFPSPDLKKAIDPEMLKKWNGVRSFFGAPEQSPEEYNLEEWFEEIVFPETGDGKGGDGFYAAEVIESDLPELIGKTAEWGA
jgi:hypothetical protein